MKLTQKAAFTRWRMRRDARNAAAAPKIGSGPGTGFSGVGLVESEDCISVTVELAVEPNDWVKVAEEIPSKNEMGSVVTLVNIPWSPELLIEPAPANAALDNPTLREPIPVAPVTAVSKTLPGADKSKVKLFAPVNARVGAGWNVTTAVPPASWSWRRSPASGLKPVETRERVKIPCDNPPAQPPTKKQDVAAWLGSAPKRTNAEALKPSDAGSAKALLKFMMCEQVFKT